MIANYLGRTPKKHKKLQKKQLKTFQKISQ